MNIALASPRRARPRVAVVGAGPGGLAAAMLLAAAGARVTVFERDGVVGGRARTLEAPGGYRFDLGPTFFLYPRILAEIFARCGARLEEEVALRRLDPQYRLVFEGGGGCGGATATLDATSDAARMEAEIARLCPADARGLRGFLAENRAKLAAFRPVLERAFGSPADLLDPGVLRALRLLRPHRSVDADLARHFSDPRVRLAFSFQTKYLGMSPFRCPSLFTILAFLEYEHGVFHPTGGCGAVAAAMARVAERLGVEFRLGEAVERIAFARGRAAGVETRRDGRLHPVDAVVVNADFVHAVPRLIPDALRRRRGRRRQPLGGWSDARIARARLSCSTFMLYLGVEGPLPPDLAHHTILLAEDYRRNIAEIGAGVLPERPSLYVQHAGATDPGMAPPGHSSLYVLVPVPNLRATGAALDWEREAPRYRRVVLDRLRALGLGDVERRIRYERVVTPRGWEDEFAVGQGATFNLAHDLGQMLWRRPGNRFAEAPGVYLVGGGTHPGSGLPVIYEGARITADLLLRDLGHAPAAAPRPDAVAPAGGGGLMTTAAAPAWDPER